MRIENKICSICDSEDWFDLDYLRDKEYWFNKDWIYDDEKVGFKICKNCGFVTYDYKTLEWLENHYNQERKIVRDGNIITCNRKNLYHKAFFDKSDKLIEMFTHTNKKYLDVGMAQGALLNLLNKEYGIDKSNLYGTEYSKAFRDFGRYEYGLNNVSTEIDKSIKYDFISYYHVFEHVQWPDKELQTMKNILKDDGLLYLSIPYWFEVLENFDGSMANDFEHVYHLNHVNVFSIQSFKNILGKIGFEILQEDRDLYAYTALCRKSEPTTNIIKEDYKKIKETLEKQKKAVEAFKAGNHVDAYKIYPPYPEAYILDSLNKDNMKDFNKQKEIYDLGLKHCPDNQKILEHLAKALFQWDENNPEKTGFYSNNIRKSEEIFIKLDNRKPNETCWYFLAMIEGKYKKNYEKAIEYLKRILETTPVKFSEVMNLTARLWKEKGESEC